MKLEENKKRFITILHEYCDKRFNVDNLIKYLEKETDFFLAPASTKYHCNYEGGLLQHSLNVFDTLFNLKELYYENCDLSTIAIVGLFHDLCKANFYSTENKNVKTQFGWSTQKVYIVDDQLPLGHGEKSIIMLLNQGIKLTEEEMLAIRWHMSGFDNAVKGGDISLNTAQTKTKLLSLIQSADIISTYILEK